MFAESSSSFLQRHQCCRTSFFFFLWLADTFLNFFALHLETLMATWDGLHISNRTSIADCTAYCDQCTVFAPFSARVPLSHLLLLFIDFPAFCFTKTTTTATTTFDHYHSSLGTALKSSSNLIIALNDVGGGGGGGDITCHLCCVPPSNLLCITSAATLVSQVSSALFAVSRQCERAATNKDKKRKRREARSTFAY